MCFFPPILDPIPIPVRNLLTTGHVSDHDFGSYHPAHDATRSSKRLGLGAAIYCVRGTRRNEDTVRFHV